MPSVRIWRRVSRPNAALAADLVADLAAEFPVVFEGDAGGRGAGGNPARLEHDEPVVVLWQEFLADDGRGNARGLAGAGFGDDDEASMLLQGEEDLRDKWIDRQWLHCWTTGLAESEARSKSREKVITDQSVT